MIRFLMLLLLGLSLACTGCCKLPSSSTTSSSEKVYNMYFQADGEPGLRVTQIVLTPTETRVRIRFQNLSNQSTTISTARPGQMDTFFIEAADQSRRYGLVRSSGIAIGPSRDTVLPGGVKEFTLYFPPIDTSWSPVDLHEGEVHRKGVNYWSFTDVPLR